MGGKQKRQPTHPWNQNLYYAHCHSTFVSVSICVPWHLTWAGNGSVMQTNSVGRWNMYVEAVNDERGTWNEEPGPKRWELLDLLSHDWCHKCLRSTVLANHWHWSAHRTNPYHIHIHNLHLCSHNPWPLDVCECSERNLYYRCRKNVWNELFRIKKCLSQWKKALDMVFSCHDNINKI